MADWVAAGLIEPTTAEAIGRFERARVVDAPTPELPPQLRNGRVPAVAEAVGYVGGTLALAGVVLLVQRSWTDLSTAARLALTGGATLGLFVAGVLSPERSEKTFARLRWFAWLLSTAAAALFAAIAAYDGFGASAPWHVGAGAWATTVVAGALWAGRDRPLQQLSALGGAAVAAGVTVGELFSAGAAGVAVWLVGALLVGAWWRRVTSLPLLTELCGALATIIGAQLSTTTWPAFGLVLTLLSALALCGAAVVPGLVAERGEQTLLTAVGAAGLALAVPSVLTYFGRDAGVATGGMTWLAGGALLALGSKRLVRLPLLIEVLGGAGMLGGAALTATQVGGLGPVLGVVTGAALIGLGMVGGRVLHSAVGSIGLLINVPWAIAHFFPGEGRAPLLVLVSGALILGVAVLLARQTSRARPNRVAAPPEDPPPPLSRPEPPRELTRLDR